MSARQVWASRRCKSIEGCEAAAARQLASRPPAGIVQATAASWTRDQCLTKHVKLDDGGAAVGVCADAAVSGLGLGSALSIAALRIAPGQWRIGTGRRAYDGCVGVAVLEDSAHALSAHLTHPPSTLSPNFSGEHAALPEGHDLRHPARPELWVDVEVPQGLRAAADRRL